MQSRGVTAGALYPALESYLLYTISPCFPASLHADKGAKEHLRLDEV